MKKFMLYAAIFILSAAINCKAQEEDFAGEANKVRPGYTHFSIDAPKDANVPADVNLIGIWKMDEDPDPHNYFVLERRDYNNYALTYMTRGGSNRTYENFGMFFSKVGDATWINCSFPEWGKGDGCFLMKVIDYDEWGMTVALVNDPELKGLPNSAAVRERIVHDAKRRIDVYETNTLQKDIAIDVL